MGTLAYHLAVTALMLPLSALALDQDKMPHTSSEVRTYRFSPLDANSTDDAAAQHSRNPIGMSLHLPLPRQLAAQRLNIEWFVQPDDDDDWALACQRAVKAALAFERGAEIHHTRGIFTYKSQCRLPKTENKAIIFSGEGEATVLKDNGQADFILYAGSSTDKFGSRFIFQDFMIQGVYNKTSRGIMLEWANNSIIKNVVFRDLWDGIELTNVYGLTLNSTQELYIKNRFIHSNTAAHKLTINNHVCNSSPNISLAIDIASDAIAINDPDAEGCGTMIKMPGGTAFRLRGGYIEYMRREVFDFSGGKMLSADIDVGWFSLGMNEGATQTFANLSDSRIRIGMAVNQPITFDEASISGLEVSEQSITRFGNSPLTNVPTRWRTPTLIGSWAQQKNFSQVRYRKQANGEVIIEGQLTNGTAGTTVFTLPPGFRPDMIMDFTTQSTNGMTWSQVRPDGMVYAVTVASGTTGLNGIRFFTKP
jgi:hypothetical protein